jgi:hypothetical protein
MRKSTARTVLRRLRELITRRPGRHSAAYLATRPVLVAPSRSPLSSPRRPLPLWCADTPTLHLPRVPVEERVPILWDTDPAPPYIPQFRLGAQSVWSDAVGEVAR